MPSRHRVPVWLMGLTNLSYGLYGGVVAFAVPQLLGDRHVPESSIAGLTAIAFSPGFWAFLVSPILDVRFSRRWYATVLAVIASLSLVVAFLNLDHLGVLEVVLTAGFTAAYLSQSAIGGWLSAITSPEEEDRQRVDDDRQCRRIWHHGDGLQPTRTLCFPACSGAAGRDLHPVADDGLPVHAGARTGPPARP